MNKYRYYKLEDGYIMELAREDILRIKFSEETLGEIEAFTKLEASATGVGSFYVDDYAITCGEENMGYCFIKQKGDDIQLYSFSEAKMGMGWRDAQTLADRARYYFLRCGRGMAVSYNWKAHYINVGGLMDV